MSSVLWLMRMQRQAILLGALATPLFAQFSTLVTFDGTNGTQPNPLTLGADGNFYGTTQTGGATNQGTFFKMTPAGSLTTLYSFGPAKSGIEPINAALVQAPDGSFYGTANGGTGSTNAGTIFKITPTGTYTDVFNLGGNPPRPGTPGGGLTLAPDGNFYGTTNLGGTASRGTVFRMTPQGVLNVIYDFGATIGGFPLTTLVLGPDGNLYGTNSYSTSQGAGFSVYFFSISTSGAVNVVFTFSESNAPSTSNLTPASDGNFYGTTSDGGASRQASFFKVTPGGTLTTIATLPALNDADVNLIQGKDGNFYGTAGGGSAGKGVIFKITLAGAMTLLYSFCEQSGCPDSSGPESLIQAPDGSLVGTTLPSTGAGTIFRLQLPPASCAATAPPAIASVDSAGSYGGYAYFGSGSWLEIKGTNLANPSDPRLSAATNPGQWTAADFNGANAPTSLDGNSVSINGKPAYMWYISTTQLNVQAPEDAATGVVLIAASNCIGAGVPYTFMKQPLAPGLLAPSNYSANGTQYLVATFASDGAYVLDTALGASFGLNSRPAKPGDIIVAYGVGFGDVTPSILPGVIVGRSNSLVNPVTFSFGSSPATLAYSGLAGSFVGLYEFYFTVPSGLASGDYQIMVTQNGAKLPQTFSLTVQN